MSAEPTTVDEAESALEDAMADAAADFPDVPVDDVWHDMVQAVAITCPEDVGREFCRRQGVAYPVIR